MSIRTQPSRSRILRGAFSAAIVAAVSLSLATPASAATYTWLNAAVVPDGTTYTDANRGADSFSRTGVSAQIDKAEGYTWQTVVSYNGYSSAGEDSATQNGPRGYGETTASYTFRPGAAPNETVNVKAWLLEAELSGTRSTPTTLDVTEPGWDVPPPASAKITVDDLRSGRAENFTLTSYGATEGGDLWSGTTASGDTCLFVVQGDNLGSTCADASTFAEKGLSIHSQGPGISLQAALSSHAGITDEAARNAGLSRLTDSVAINAGAPVDGVLQLDDVSTGRADTKGNLQLVSIK